MASLPSGRNVMVNSGGTAHRAWPRTCRKARAVYPWRAERGPREATRRLTPARRADDFAKSFPRQRRGFSRGPPSRRRACFVPRGRTPSCRRALSGARRRRRPSSLAARGVGKNPRATAASPRRAGDGRPSRARVSAAHDFELARRQDRLVRRGVEASRGSRANSAPAHDLARRPCARQSRSRSPLPRRGTAAKNLSAGGRRDR